MPKPRLTKKVHFRYQSLISESSHAIEWPLHDLGLTAYHFAKRWIGRCIDIKKLERLVLKSPDPECSYLFAKNIQGANIIKLAKHVADCGDPSWMRKFARFIPSRESSRLNNLALVYETLGK